MNWYLFWGLTATSTQIILNSTILQRRLFWEYHKISLLANDKVHHFNSRLNRGEQEWSFVVPQNGERWMCCNTSETASSRVVGEAHLINRQPEENSRAELGEIKCCWFPVHTTLIVLKSCLGIYARNGAFAWNLMKTTTTVGSHHKNTDLVVGTSTENTLTDDAGKTISFVHIIEFLSRKLQRRENS